MSLRADRDGRATGVRRLGLASPGAEARAGGAEALAIMRERAGDPIGALFVRVNAMLTPEWEFVSALVASRGKNDVLRTEGDRDRYDVLSALAPVVQDCFTADGRYLFVTTNMHAIFKATAARSRADAQDAARRHAEERARTGRDGVFRLLDDDVAPSDREVLRAAGGVVGEPEDFDDVFEDALDEPAGEGVVLGPTPAPAPDESEVFGGAGREEVVDGVAVVDTGVSLLETTPAMPVVDATPDMVADATRAVESATEAHLIDIEVARTFVGAVRRAARTAGGLLTSRIAAVTNSFISLFAGGLGVLSQPVTAALLAHRVIVDLVSRRRSITPVQQAELDAANAEIVRLSTLIETVYEPVLRKMAGKMADPLPPYTPPAPRDKPAPRVPGEDSGDEGAADGTKVRSRKRKFAELRPGVYTASSAALLSVAAHPSGMRAASLDEACAQDDDAAWPPHIAAGALVSRGGDASLAPVLRGGTDDEVYAHACLMYSMGLRLPQSLADATRGAMELERAPDVSRLGGTRARAARQATRDLARADVVARAREMAGAEADQGFVRVRTPWRALQLPTFVEAVALFLASEGTRELGPADVRDWINVCVFVLDELGAVRICPGEAPAAASTGVRALWERDWAAPGAAAELPAVRAGVCSLVRAGISAWVAVTHARVPRQLSPETAMEVRGDIARILEGRVRDMTLDVGFVSGGPHAAVAAKFSTASGAAAAVSGSDARSTSFARVLEATVNAGAAGHAEMIANRLRVEVRRAFPIGDDVGRLAEIVRLVGHNARALSARTAQGTIFSYMPPVLVALGSLAQHCSQRGTRVQPRHLFASAGVQQYVAQWVIIALDNARDARRVRQSATVRERNHMLSVCRGEVAPLALAAARRDTSGLRFPPPQRTATVVRSVRLGM